MLTPDTPGGRAVRRSVAASGGGADDVEAGPSGRDSPRGAGGDEDMGAVCGALLLTVYLPRAILSFGSGLCLVVRPLFARHLGCNDTQTGLIAAAVPLVRRGSAPRTALSAPARGY